MASIQSRVDTFGKQLHESFKNIAERAPGTVLSIMKTEADFINNDALPEVSGLIKQVTIEEREKLKAFLEEAAANGSTIQIKAILPTGVGGRVIVSTNELGAPALSLGLVFSTSAGASIGIITKTSRQSLGNFVKGSCGSSEGPYPSAGIAFSAPYFGERINVKPGCIEGNSFISVSNATESSASAYLQLNNIDAKNLFKMFGFDSILTEKEKIFEEMWLEGLKKSTPLSEQQIKYLKEWRKENYPPAKIGEMYNFVLEEYFKGASPKTDEVMSKVVIGVLSTKTKPFEMVPEKRPWPPTQVQPTE